MPVDSPGRPMRPQVNGVAATDRSNADTQTIRDRTPSSTPR